MKISTSFILIVTALIDYIIWTMGKVPYGPLCWVVPLILGIIFEVYENLE